jgi:hypothetical protein
MSSLAAKAGAELLWKETREVLDNCQELTADMWKEVELIEKERMAIRLMLSAQKERTDRLMVKVTILKEFMEAAEEASRDEKSIE